MGAGIIASHRDGESFLNTRAIKTITSVEVLKDSKAVAPDFIYMEGYNGQAGYTINFDWSTTGDKWRDATDAQRMHDVEIYKKAIKAYSGHTNVNRIHADRAYKKAQQAALDAGKSPAVAAKAGRDAFNAYMVDKFINEFTKLGGKITSIKSKSKALRI